MSEVSANTNYSLVSLLCLSFPPSLPPSLPPLPPLPPSLSLDLCLVLFVFHHSVCLSVFLSVSFFSSVLFSFLSFSIFICRYLSLFVLSISPFQIIFTYLSLSLVLSLSLSLFLSCSHSLLLFLLLCFVSFSELFRVARMKIVERSCLGRFIASLQRVHLLIVAQAEHCKNRTHFMRSTLESHGWSLERSRSERVPRPLRTRLQTTSRPRGGLRTCLFPS